MLKSFLSFINESNETVHDLVHLFDLGMIGSDEFYSKIIPMARENRVDLAKLVGDRPAWIKVDMYGADLDLRWLERWRGASGERVIVATGWAGEDGVDLNILLSNGAEVHLKESARYWDPTFAELRIGDRKFNLSEEEYYDYTDRWYEEDGEDWDERLSTLLSMIAALGDSPVINN